MVALPRFWDKRADAQSNEITLQSKVTSMDLAAGKCEWMEVGHSVT